MFGGIQADQSISFQLMEKKLTQFVDIIRQDPAVQSVVGFTGGGQTNGGFVFVVLKPLAERHVSMQRVMGRLRPKLNEVAGARLFLQPCDRHPGRRAGELRAIPVHPAGRRRRTRSTNGRPSSKRHCKRCRC